MLCEQLTSAWRDSDESDNFAPRNLLAGSKMEEPYVRPECQLSAISLRALREGKDASIEDMLAGGNGFPAPKLFDPMFETIFDLGCQQEQRDLKALISTRSY